MGEEIEAVARGRVQGVMYRDFVRRAAGKFGVCGFMENAPDGTVRVVAQGTPDALKALVERLYRGSVLARVESVAVLWRTPERRYEEFSIRY